MFRRIFTLPFSEPISAGFSSAPKNTRMLAYQALLIVLISLQPPHGQRDPPGESRDSVFIRCFFGSAASKLLPVQQTDHIT